MNGKMDIKLEWGKTKKIRFHAAKILKMPREKVFAQRNTRKEKIWDPEIIPYSYTHDIII